MNDVFKEYKVTWTIDIEATNPEEAAIIAWRTFFARNHTANVFDVKDPNEKTTRIDLEEKND